MNDISNNIKKVLIVFLLCFIALIVYISYFEIFVSPKIVSNPMNKRSWVKRNEVLRGTIYDRNGKPLTKSSKVNELTQKREYTGGDLFAHVLGYADVRYGITGLERKYDSDLMANDTDITSFFNIGKKKEEKIGHNLITTLNYDMQKKAFDMLGNRRGAVVALNPKTGEILTMVSKPSFNPNSLNKIWDAINADKNRPLLNRAVSGLYPPGSTFKIITAASSLENINGIKSRTFHDNGKLVFNSKQSLSNYGGEVLGTLSFKNAFVHSSNVVFGQLGLDLGNEKLKATAEKFGFNKDIEADGIIIDNSKFPSYKKYEKGNIAQSAIGQSEVLASPMEMALVASTVANEGTMMKPTLVKKVITSKGNVVKEMKPESIGEVMTKDSANTLKEYMRAVVAGGTGTAANIAGLNICGKTGTADHGKGKAHSWFAAFAPYENPQIAVAVIVEEGGQGAGAAAQIAAQVIKTGMKK